MTKGKHTPGPWTMEGSRVIAQIYGFTPTPEHPQFVVAQCGTYCSAVGDERIGNAQLIAAAPDLLEALKANIDGKVSEGSLHCVHPSGRFCKTCGRNSEIKVHCEGCPVEMAELAIAKAEGRTK